MEKENRKYRIMLAVGVFMTALCLTATLVVNSQSILMAGAMLFIGVAVYGSWRIWSSIDRKRNREEPLQTVGDDPLIMSLTSSLAAAYMKGAGDMTEMERSLVLSYLTHIILLVIGIHTVFVKKVFIDLLEQGPAGRFIYKTSWQNLYT